MCLCVMQVNLRFWSECLVPSRESEGGASLLRWRPSWRFFNEITASSELCWLVVGPVGGSRRWVPTNLLFWKVFRILVHIFLLCRDHFTTVWGWSDRRHPGRGHKALRKIVWLARKQNRRRYSYTECSWPLRISSSSDYQPSALHLPCGWTTFTV